MNKITQAKDHMSKVTVTQELYAIDDIVYVSNRKGVCSKVEVITIEEFIHRIVDLDKSENDFEIIQVVNDKIIISIAEIESERRKKIEGLSSCIYQTKTSHIGLKLEKIDLYCDQYIDMNNNIVDYVFNDIQQFIDNKGRYKKLNLIHKRGLLLYGPPGNGKTTIINEVVNRYKNTCNLIYISETYHIRGLIDYRELISTKNTIFIIEELTQYCKDESLSDLLLFLDGIYSWNGMYVIATTNYPDQLPYSIIDRKSRFDKIIKIDNPNEITRKKYLQALLGNKFDEKLVLETKDFSIACIKELCIQILLHDKNPIDLLKEMRNDANILKDNFQKNDDTKNMTI